MNFGFRVEDLESRIKCFVFRADIKPPTLL